MNHLRPHRCLIHSILFLFSLSGFSINLVEATIISHACTDITQIPEAAIHQAKSTLHIGYGHTSHGSQLTTGMTGLIAFANIALSR